MRQQTKGCMPEFPYKRLCANASRTKIVPHVLLQEDGRGKMVALFSISSFTAPTAKQLPSRRSVPLPIPSSNKHYSAQEWPNLLQRLSLHALASALSFGLILTSPPPSLSLHPPTPQSPPITTNTTIQFCQDDGDDLVDEIAPELVTNEGIVEEAWQIVNDTFIDAGHHRWSPEMWLQKREDFLGTSIPTRSRAHDIIRRMLASLGDPYTRFLSPTEMARYDVTGVGINLREIPDVNGGIKLKVLGIILDGPAHSAGIRQGDEILSVNGVDIKGKSSFEVSSMLQGPNETFVTIEVKHGNCGPTKSYQVQRQVIARTPVFYRLEPVENGTASIGYIRLKEFNALARKDLVIAMKHLQDSGASYFVLDLRGNLGGLVQAGIEVAKLFLDKGETVTYTVGRDPQFQRTIVADASPLVTAPVIIVVNNRTASASEIVATALHDNCRAVLMGERTFGKGLIQSVFELHDGSGVVVTVGKYVTPKHMDINGNGVEPDFSRMPAWSTVTKHLMQCNMQRRG